jgi:hypothetical protein
VRAVQRAVEIDEVEVENDVPTVDPAPPPPPAPSSVAPPANGAVAAPTPSAGSPAAPAVAANAAQDTEHLREQVLRWVRSELLVNRERAGRLTDLR